MKPQGCQGGLPRPLRLQAHGTRRAVLSPQIRHESFGSRLRAGQLDAVRGQAHRTKGVLDRDGLAESETHSGSHSLLAGHLVSSRCLRSARSAKYPPPRSHPLRSGALHERREGRRPVAKHRAEPGRGGHRGTIPETRRHLRDQSAARRGLRRISATVETRMGHGAHGAGRSEQRPEQGDLCTVEEIKVETPRRGVSTVSNGSPKSYVLRPKSCTIASMITLKSVSKSFSGRKVLSDISLQINPGEFVCIIGRSGAGKSTLVHLIAGAEEVSSGTIAVDGVKLHAIPPMAMRLLRRRVGIVFQDGKLLSHLTVRENIAFPLEVCCASDQEIRKRT